MKFQPGEEVIVVDGDFKGEYGTVSQYLIDSVIVDIAREVQGSFKAVIQESCLDHLPAEEKADDDSDEGVIDIPVHEFGISEEAFQRHLEYLIGRSLAQVGQVGPNEAFFGFQEFEGKTASEVLFELMFKLEEGMAMFAQAHILIGRIVASLENVHDQIK